MTRAASVRPTVFLHIGEPKTGTTYLQEIVWRNRGALARAGVELPGHAPSDQFRAMQDLRDIPPESDDPGGSWTGEWAILAEQARHARRTALISQESICAANEAQVERAIRSLEGADVQVIVTIRDFASLLPAEWQETIKHRRTLSWPEWMDQVIATEPAPGTRAQGGFWRTHDTSALLRLWSRFVAPERIHVITMPPRTSDPEVLWQRLAGLLGVDDVAISSPTKRRNPSLGYAEIEFLRQLNPALTDRVPNWFYAAEVKQALAHEVLAERDSSAKVALCPEQLTWARARAHETVQYLRTADHHLVGDLQELLPSGEPATFATLDPAATADAAVAALAVLIENQHRRRRSTTVTAGSHGHLGAYLRRSPRLKRTLREVSRRPHLQWTRTAGWQLHEVLLRRQRRDTPR